MRKPSASKALATLAALAALCLCQAARAAPALDFDQVFNDRAEPARLHFQAAYVVNGVKHRLEAWREGGSQLRRRADDAVETFIFRRRGEADWRMVVLDLARNIRTDLDRTSLARVGHFTDWFGLAHGLARPAGAYTLVQAAAPALAVSPLAPCRWYRLTESSRASDVCWSSRLRLPLLIADASGVQWQVTGADTRVGKDAMVIADQGFVKNDAAADIKGD